MSFACSDSCENGKTKENVRTKGSGKLPFSEYLSFSRIGKEWACLHCGGSFLVSDSTTRSYSKVAGLTRKIQSSSKLRQFQKWQAEISDTQLGLTGIGIYKSQSIWTIVTLELSQYLISGSTFSSSELFAASSYCSTAAAVLETPLFVLTCATSWSAAPRAWPLILQSKNLIVLWNTLWVWLPDDLQGLKLGLKLELCIQISK